MDDDDADISPAAFRLSASAARTLVKRQARAEARKKAAKAREQGKDEASAIEIPTSPSVISIESGASDDEFEEVPIPGPGPGSADPQSLDVVEGQVDDEEPYILTDEEEEQVIRLEIGGETEADKAKALELAMRKKPMTAKDRAIRMEIHKMHTIALLASTRIRNRWASDDVLKARLLSLLPHPLHAAFTIPPKRFPDRAQRSRLFIDALQGLASWWCHSFFDISDETLGARTRTWDEVQEVIERLPPVDKWELKGGKWTSRYVRVEPEDRKGKGKEKKKDKDLQDPMMQALTDEFGGERLRSVNSLMKKALQQSGSRDVSAQLFVSLCRACGLGARLVVSVQAVPWRAEKSVAKPKKKGAGSGGRTMASRQGMGEDGASEEDEMEEVPIPGVPSSSAPSTPATPGPSKKSRQRGGHVPKMADPADIYRLRKQRPAPQTLAAADKPKKKKKELMTAQPPVFWAEVFSRSDQRWVPVDPVTGIVRKKAQYDPGSDSRPVRMVYVVAYEEDGYARDVTLRYAKNFGARTSKLRPPARPGEEDWWASIVRILQRPQRLNRDELEDAELEMSGVNEGMPLVMSGFKDHPLYVLERHLKQNEVILPRREIGRFKGEPVFRRSNVLSCKTAETWMRVGRRVKPRQEPLKWIKQRAVTIQKRRAQELAIQEGQEPVMQGLYAEYQTELYKPPPIENGIIPQNAFGNIDLYTPSMLPEGAVHLPYKGIAKVAKSLGLSYADAVTSFEFKRQKATPVITGIVVAKENEEVLLDAYWKSAAAAEEKEKARRETQALKRWAKLINGMRVRKRLQAEYGTGEELHERTANPMALAPQARTAASIISNANRENMATWRAGVLDRLDGESDEDIKEEPEEPKELEESGEAHLDVPEPEPMQDEDEELTPPPEPTPRRITLRLKPPSAAATPEPQVQTTRSGRPLRGAAAATTNGTAHPPPPEPVVLQPVPAPKVGRMKPKMKPRPKATVPAAAPVPSAPVGVPTPAPKTAKTPKTTNKGKGRKRKAESESEAEDTSGSDAPAPAAKGKAKPKAKAAPVPAPTRTLRSRAPKTAEQLAAEEEKARRMREMLESDEEEGE